MTPSRRMRSWLFRVFLRDGSTEWVLFYAPTAALATKYARAWAQRLGHRRVELEEGAA